MSLLGLPSAYAVRHLAHILDRKGFLWSRQEGRIIQGTDWRLLWGTPKDAPMAARMVSDPRAWPLKPESLAIVRDYRGTLRDLVVYGSDELGLAYALYEVARAIELTGTGEDVFQGIEEGVERPTLRIRSVIRTMMNRKLDREWFFATGFWESYLDNLVATRHNRLKLSIGWRSAYFSPPFPFLVAVPGYPQVSVTHLTPQERTQNLAMIQSVAAMAKDRGLEFYLDMYWMSHRSMGDWAEARRYRVEGLTAETIGDYTRQGVKTLLDACTDIDGLGISGSMVENGFTQEDMYFLFDGVAACDRPVALQIELKGVNQELVNQATRRGIHVTLGGKYCMEHQGLPYHPTQIRFEELESSGPRRWTRNSYADMLYQPRAHDFMFNLWNWGTQKILTWGNPAMVGKLARNACLSGSLGLEHGDPLTYKGSYSSGPEGNWRIVQDPSLEFYDWEYKRYWLHYVLFGRLMYNPDCSPEVWHREFRHRVGPGTGDSLQAALAWASKTMPLITMSHAPSASDNLYWPEVYTNVPISTPAPDFLSRDGGAWFGLCSPSDTALFYRVDDFVSDYLRNQVGEKIDPFTTGKWFEGIGQATFAELDKAQSSDANAVQAEFRTLWIDTSIQGNLAFFFGCKFAAAAHFTLYRDTGDLAALNEAIEAYENGLRYWRLVVRLAPSIYPPHLAFHNNGIMSGDWAAREGAIVSDLEQMKTIRQNYLAQYGSQPLSFAHVPVWEQSPSHVTIATSLKGWEHAKAVRVLYVTDQDAVVKRATLVPPHTLSPLYAATLRLGEQARWLRYSLEAESTSGKTIQYPGPNCAEGLEIALGQPVTAPKCEHEPPTGFERGKPLPLHLKVHCQEDLKQVRLHYRHVNQAERVLQQDMTVQNGSFLGVIPAIYTDSRFELMYYFSIIDRMGNRVLYPGFEDEFDAPYLVCPEVDSNL